MGRNLQRSLGQFEVREGLEAVATGRAWRAGEAENLGTRMDADCVAVDDGHALHGALSDVGGVGET